MGIFPIVAFLLATFYVPTYATAVLGLPPFESLLVTMGVGLALLVWLPCCGALSDRIGRWPPIIVASALALATSYPAMAWLAAEPTIARLLLVDLWIIFLNGLYFGAMAPLYAEALPITIRTSGLAIVFSLSNGIFGTLTPVVSTYLIAITSNRAAPAIWLSAVAALGLTAALTTRYLATPAIDNRQNGFAAG
jgi:MHS family citrate/tricarballylate:H+ symporter-like MFS transporter